MRIAVTILLVCVTALLALGMVMLYSSSMAQVGAHYLVRQLLWAGLGLVLFAVAARLDYLWLERLAWVLYGVAVVLLVAVLLPQIGLRLNGARRWLGAGDFRFQPSEFAKLALLVWLAAYGERHQRQMGTWRGVAVPGLVIGVVLGLVFREPDVGTTVLLAAVCGAVLLVAGVRWRTVLPPALAAASALALYLWHDPIRLKRILAWWYPEQSREGAGYQAWQAMVAFGAGGWRGLGLGNGRQKLGFVPEHHTDFIFSVIGEELGLVATLLVVLAFLLIVLCGVFIALNARETFGLLLGTGITFLIGLQALINIGVVTSALPNKGLPLPWISYGGSNLLVMLTSVGLLVSIARRAAPAPGNRLFPAPRPANPFAAPPAAAPTS